jgi:hypothetical protein
MPRKLTVFPAGANRRYPWEQWLNGEIWQLFSGEDYFCTTRTLMTNSRSQAKRLGGKVRTRILSEGGRESIVIQFQLS